MKSVTLLEYNFNIEIKGKKSVIKNNEMNRGTEKEYNISSVDQMTQNDTAMKKNHST